ncbi:hypothetical protein B0J11DRAFT_521304 [Dendryphion nanum]|uniref:Copper acquisition factor BIM1-like domain-containing protein n=1 Tax=Dendryphion nanum TaxID=256645 RepID=A0A9P9ITY3_9PLEO|nr:hypothetical protein B0J11DRAFT_521304 [Dendryphion nanum]
MRLSLISSAALLLSSAAAQKHGEGEEGRTMGPVAFMWPADRVWTAADDNRGPCGSPAGVTNRTKFPLAQGSVALSIADDAWHVAFRISYAENPTRQAEFSSITNENATDIDPGHQCYKLNQIEGKTAGQNATIQMEYWAEYEGENNGNNQSFFACADITFVESKDFTTQIPCFNVTTDNFNEPTPTGTKPTSSATNLGSSSSNSASSIPAPSSGGLSTGAKAGIAVGAIVGGLAIIGAIAFFIFRHGKQTGLQNRNSYELRAAKLNDGDASTKSTPSTRPANAV